MPDETSPWVVKGVSQSTRRKVKVYAAEHDMTMAQALEVVVGNGADFEPQEVQQLLKLMGLVLKSDWPKALKLAEEIQASLRAHNKLLFESEFRVERGQRLQSMGEEEPDE